MRIGGPAEITNNEYRVGMVPSAAMDLTSDGLEVLTGHSDSWPTIEGHTEEGDLPRAACLVK